MESKILLKITTLNDIESFKGEYNGVYVNFTDLQAINGKDFQELFVDLTSADLNQTLTVSNGLTDKNATFVVDDISKAVLIKSFNKTAKISYRLNGFNKEILPFLTVNGLNVTITYTTLAPERVDAFHQAGVKVNGVFVKRLDELGVLKYYNTDYITILPEIK